MKILLTVIILAAIVLGFVYAAGTASEKADAASVDLLEKTIRRAAVQCYAIEGFYPPDIDYLEENYGIIIDSSRFIVIYRAYMANNQPVIRVVRI